MFNFKFTCKLITVITRTIQIILSDTERFFVKDVKLSKFVAISSRAIQKRIKSSKHFKFIFLQINKIFQVCKNFGFSAGS